MSLNHNLRRMGIVSQYFTLQVDFHSQSRSKQIKKIVLWLLKRKKTYYRIQLKELFEIKYIIEFLKNEKRKSAYDY